MNLMKEEYFWSVCIEEGSVQSAIWTIREGTAQVTEIGSPVSWEDSETLIKGADESLSSCIQNLPENVPEPSKTVFGVPSSWVEDGQIKREHLDKVRLICNKLSLNPTGFVVLPEAIAHFEKSEEKTPMNGVLIGIYPQSLDVSLFRLGNLVGSVNVARSVNVVDDVVEGLARFESTEILPSRFLLYDAKMHDLEDLKQNLIKADWNDMSNKVKFLHTPQVEILESKAKMAAVSLAGASETGSANKVVFGGKEKTEEKKELLKDSPDNNIEGLVDPEALGFRVGEDINLPEKVQAKSEILPKQPKKVLSEKLNSLGVKKIISENLLFIAVIVLFFLLVGCFVIFWFLPKAVVTVYVTPQKIESKEAIKFDTTANSINASSLTVPAKNISTSVSTDKTKTTTGTAIVGTPAKGSVTFYNVGGATTIPAGTVLTGTNLNFTLNNDVNVASASGAASAATVDGNITASGVGADYNLASGTFFTVGNFSSSLLQAKNNSDLTGGTSQEVTAVSKDDINSLVNDLTNELTNDGESNLKTNLSPGTYLVDNSINLTITGKDFDHQVGDQTSTVKLSITGKVSGLTVSQKDMFDLANQVFGSKIPSGYSLSINNIDFKFESKDVDFMINLLPNINANKLKTSITGISLNNLKSVLEKIPGYQDYHVQSKSKIPLFNFLPHVPANISIVVEGK